VAKEDAPAEAGAGDPARLERRLDLRLGADGLATPKSRAAACRAGGDAVELELARSSTSSSAAASRRPMAAEMLAAVPNVSMYTFKARAPRSSSSASCSVTWRATPAAGAEGCFTPGGSIANLVALLLARNVAAPDSRDRGLAPARLAIYTSAEGHYSIPKNAGILGLGRESVRRIPTDGAGRMEVDALARRLEEDRARGVRPALINATAGTTVRGAFDPLRAIAALARAHGAWLHVDGALGGSVVLCPSRRELIDGRRAGRFVGLGPAQDDGRLPAVLGAPGRAARRAHPEPRRDRPTTSSNHTRTISTPVTARSSAGAATTRSSSGPPGSVSATGAGTSASSASSPSPGSPPRRSPPTPRSS